VSIVIMNTQIDRYLHFFISYHKFWTRTYLASFTDIELGSIPRRFTSSSTSQPWKRPKIARSTKKLDPTRSMLSKSNRLAYRVDISPNSSARANKPQNIDPVPTKPIASPRILFSATLMVVVISSFGIVGTSSLSVDLVARYGSRKADVKNCMPATVGSIGSRFGFRFRSSLKNPANMAAHDNNKLKMPSSPGWTTGAKGKSKIGLTRKKLRERPRFVSPTMWLASHRTSRKRRRHTYKLPRQPLEPVEWVPP